MSTAVVLAAEGEINPGEHWTVEVAGIALNMDTILATVIAMAIVLGLGFYMVNGVTRGKPTKLQLAFEALTSWVRGQVRDGLGLQAPTGLIAFAFTTFAFILICNWLAALPSEHVLPPPTADVNLVYAMTIVVFIWLNVWAIRKSPRRYVKHIAEPYAFLAPIEIITLYFSRPLSLALRLFGNIFAGGIMVSVIALLPVYILWLPNAGWKLFDMFIGGIQALIFTLLTIIYFSDYAHDEEHAH
ncbi:F0F1 ATP synthase subunit A [Pseudonocardia endophytica]|uniref:ATP synthase subunit a n=1 Tax=Pseudonocardia endophytica TaxID=401976 RepID=A0A4R1HM45_PSEEN|nr:F0F1 ATP synthase subunit A [Pseudonocardia endophytica]TCK20719.1 F-type H+-transporting ATPase subunit a [Pseudonocardia endophytica]